MLNLRSLPPLTSPSFSPPSPPSSPPPPTITTPLILSPRDRIQLDESVGVPHSLYVDAAFTDFYQVTMMYAYWKAGQHKNPAVFDMFFRKCPFGGEYAIFGGLEEVMRYLNTLRFSTHQIEYLCQKLPAPVEPEFLEYLQQVDASELTVYAVAEGTLVFPREPLIRVEGPLAVAQLVETAILNLTNYPTLIATNAARFRLAAGWDKTLLEFGARRAQGPNGAMSASRYVYLGGFDATSNVSAGYTYDIPIQGTHAHSYITSFRDLRCIASKNPPGCPGNFVEMVLAKKTLYEERCSSSNKTTLMNEGELAAFISYAQAFPKNFLCLVDTYDTLLSGIPNFIVVALALIDCGHEPVGIRLDSGDLAYLSSATREKFQEADAAFGTSLVECRIIASNDVNESVLKSLQEHRHSINAFGIGTQLVTCQAQPALGMVYKLCEIKGEPCMKLSQDIDKISIPSRKALYRLYRKSGEPAVDIMQSWGAPVPSAGEKIFCRHLFDDTKRCFVVPSRVESLLTPVWDRGKRVSERCSLAASRSRCMEQLKSFRRDHLRPVNPTPYKVTSSLEFYQFFHEFWNKTAPVYTIE